MSLITPLVKLKHVLEFWKTKYSHKQGFFYKGKYYPYFYNMYNATWKFDRRYEVPIFIKVLEGYTGEEILEVGNTLSHYVDVNYDILDKYEIAEGVINEDICTFNPKKKYDLIISISTLEHIGLYQYGKGNSEEVRKAFENIYFLLKPKGKLVFSYTSDGYNPELEKLIEDLGIKTEYFKIVRKGELRGVRIGEVSREELRDRLERRA